MNQLKKKGSKSSLTTHNRVLKETSELATLLAKRWNCSKVEVYRYLVQIGLDHEPDNQTPTRIRKEISSDY